MARKRGRPWVKLWGDVVRTRKIAQLSDSQFRWWINLLAIATEYDGEGEGRLPDVESIAHILRREVEETEEAVLTLIGLRLIDVDGSGDYRMHEYREWQEGDVPSSLPVPAPVKKRVIRKTEVAPEDARELSPIQACVAGYCEAVGIDPRELGGLYGRYSKAFMGLSKAGYTQEDCRRLARFVQTSDYWRGNRGTPPPEMVVAQVGAWKASGKPETWSPGMRQVTNGRISTATAAQLRSQT